MNNRNQTSYTLTDYLRGTGILARAFVRELPSNAWKITKIIAVSTAIIIALGKGIQSIQDGIDGDRKIRLDTNTVLHKNGVIESVNGNTTTYFDTSNQSERLKTKTNAGTVTFTRAFNELSDQEVKLYQEWMLAACHLTKAKQTPSAINFDGFINRHCQ